jgi:dipeptidyl aminopeptidase/acylaminoacyl peptidase
VRGDRPAQEPVRLTEVWHRWSNWPEKRTVYAFQPGSGTKIRIAADDQYGVAGATLSPDGRKLVLTRDVRLSERPFVRSEIWIMELAEGRSYKLLDLVREVFNGPSTFAWSSDGKAVAFCASVRELVEDSTRSAFQPELYVVFLDRPRLRRVPSPLGGAVGQGLGCNRIRWSEDGRLYLPLQLGARNLLARSSGPVMLDPEQARLEVLETPEAVVGPYDVAGTTVVAAFEGPTAPPRLFKTSTGRLAWQAIGGYQPPDQLLFPYWHPWSFIDSEGFEIEGWYLTPPRFDPGVKHPLIVFYYGGTLPTSLGFSKRLLWYASQGYVVYVLNPAGTPGYGQKFADLHINDWGYPAGSDILEGVEAFLRDHPFVDPTRVGNFGHSYGGFMTMHLLTRSDRFAASVSIAGISNIAGYWGAGWWGFSYTEGTCPGCYPWNRRDVFVDRSPLFSADRIRTPLLLIHGSSDNNVVPTESEQIFTALRVLGRPVELVRVPGEDHGINSTPSAERLRDSLILEWFDRYLRDRPEAWQARWETSAATGTRGRIAR